jgi:hypothetical protein
MDGGRGRNSLRAQSQRPKCRRFKACACKALPRGSQFRSGVVPFFPSLPPVTGFPCRQAGRQNGGGSRRRKNHFVLLERFSARLLAVQIVRTLIAVGPGSYEILRRIIFLQIVQVFLHRFVCLSLSDVCVCVLHQNLCPAASILISRIVEAKISALTGILRGFQYAAFSD